MQSIQKKVKYSKGEVNSSLEERNLSIIDSSAKFMRNCISTVYGTAKTRFGTVVVDEILSSLKEVTSAKTSYIGGDVADFGTLFTSDSINNATDEIKLDVSTGKIYETIKLTGIRLGFENGSIEATIGSGAITGVTVIDGGLGYKNISIEVIGDGTGAVLDPVIDNNGSITSVTITDGGSGYTNATLAITEIDQWEDIQSVYVSNDDVSYTKLKDITITRNPQTFSLDNQNIFRYLKLTRDGSEIKTNFNIVDMLIYDTVETGNKVKLDKFVFNEDQKYLFAFTDETLRVYENDDLLESIPASGIKEDYFSRLKTTQAEDTMVVTNPNLYPKKITRTQDPAITTFIPQFDSESGGSSGGYTITADSDNTYKMLDRDDSTSSSRGSVLSDIMVGEISTKYDYILPNNIIIDFDSEKNLKQTKILVRDIKSYKLYYKDNVGSYHIIRDHTFLIENGYTSQKRIITISSDVQAYGIKLELVGVKSYSYTEFDDTYTTNWYPVKVFEISCFDVVSNIFNVADFDLDNIPFYLFGDKIISNKTVGITPTQAEGSCEINADSSVFNSSHVGQYINTSIGSRFKITSYTSSTKVSGYTIIPFLNTSKITSWNIESGYERAWSEERGYPNTCLFYQQRLWFGGSKSVPQSIWGSRLGEYNNFDNVGSYANDSIDAPIASKETNDIVNIIDNRGLQVFTIAGEYIASETSLTPDDIVLTPTTQNGSVSFINPVRLGGSTLFMEKNNKSLLNFLYNDVEANYKTDSISLLCSHMIQNPVAIEVDSNSNRDVGDYLYMVLQDGTMLISCILLDQEINAFTRFATKDGYIKDIKVVKSDVYLLIERQNKLYIEKIADVKTDATIIKDPALTLTGLEKFDGQEVRVYNDTKDYGTYTVESGSITLSELPTEKVFVGLDFETAIVSHDIKINQQSRSKHKRISRATIATKDTTKIKLNGREKTVKNDFVDFYSVTGYTKKANYEISSVFDRIEVLSTTLHLNFGG